MTTISTVSTTSASAVWDASRFIACLVIGGSSNDVSKRRIGFPIWEKGWKGYIKEQVFPVLNLGFRRLSIHNPAGALLGEAMAPDQFIHAKEAGCLWVETDFVENWRKITGPGNIDVICYMGDLKTDSNFKELASGKYTKDDWLKRIYDSYRLPLDAGMSLAFDALFDIREDDPSHRFYQLISSLGVKTYLEPQPHLNNPFLYKANFIITEQLFKHKDLSWAAPDSVLSGERIRLLNQPYDATDTRWQRESEWLPKWINSCRKSNYSAMFGPWGMLSRGQTVADLLNIPYDPVAS